MQISFHELGSYCFDISDIFASEQRASGKTRFIMHNPRPTDALLLFADTTGTCYRKGAQPIYIPQGSLVYMPHGSNYMWENTPARSGSGQKNLLFEFSLSRAEFHRGEKNELCRDSQTGERITFGKHVSIVTHRHAALYEKLFNELIGAFSRPNAPLCILSAAYAIFGAIADNCRAERISSADTHIIKDSIKFLESDEYLQKSIGEIAAECNISIGYYERLFADYCGMTPTEYRSMNRINRIKMLLHDEKITLEEIAEKTGCCDSGYLCRIFKKKTGMTPGEYRRIYFAQMRDNA